MEKILLLLSIVYAEFRVHSPDSLNKLNFNIQISTIGNPCLYPTYGKLLKSHNCQINNKLQYDDIVVASNVSQEFIENCVEVVEKMGGRGVIIVQNKPAVIFEDALQEKMKVFVLGIEEKVFKEYLQEVSDVWISYRYDLLQSSYPFIEVKFSGNFTKDFELVENLRRFDGRMHILWENVRYLIVYEDRDNSLPEDCVTSPSDSIYCKKGNSLVKGKQILEIYSIILSVYNQLNKKNISETFINFLTEVFIYCNYDANCTLNSAFHYIPNFFIDPEILDLYTIYEKTQGIIAINTINILWPSYLETAFCLSFYDPPSNCQKCSQGCLFSDLQSENCSIWCNNQDCGYSNLICLQKSGCYSFMLNDGNCNLLCENDPDCEDDGLYIKFFVYTVLTCCIIIFVVFCGTSLLTICKKNDPSLLEGQIKSTSEMELKSQQIEDVQVRLCPLDMAEIIKTDPVVVTPCNHAFHLECIKKIISSDSFLYECPCCREELKDFKIL